MLSKENIKDLISSLFTKTFNSYVSLNEESNIPYRIYAGDVAGTISKLCLPVKYYIWFDDEREPRLVPAPSNATEIITNTLDEPGIIIFPHYDGKHIMGNRIVVSMGHGQYVGFYRSLTD